MDSHSNFNSDSTYCSAYENSQKSVQSLKSKRKKFDNAKSSSQFLDQVHNEVLLHLEGKLLMGRIQVQQYMKKISKLNLKSAKDQYFAEKIHSSLRKIYKLTKHFEKSFSLSEISIISDPLGNHSSNGDLKILENNTKDPKRILLRSPSLNCENNSFPLDLLSNNNFMSLTPQQSAFPINISGNPLQKNQAMEEIEKNKFRYESLELVSTENNKLYLENNLENSTDARILFKKPLSPKRGPILKPETAVAHSTKKHITATTTNDAICIYENSEAEDFVDKCKRNKIKKDAGNNILSKSNAKVKDSSLINSFLCDRVKEPPSNNIERQNCGKKGNMFIITDMINTDEVQLCKSNSYDVPENIYEVKHDVDENSTYKEFNDIVSKIIWNMETDSTQNHSDSKVEISETFYDQDQNSGALNINSVKKPNLETIMKLGDFFDESYNTKISKTCYGLGKQSENKTWQEIHTELEYDANLPRNVNCALINCFEKLSLEEHERNEREYKNKLVGRGSVHNFSEEDEKKLDWESFIEKNEVKLESLSEYFSEYLKLEKTKTTDICDDDDFDGLNWKKLLE